MIVCVGMMLMMMMIMSIIIIIIIMAPVPESKTLAAFNTQTRIFELVTLYANYRTRVYKTSIKELYYYKVCAALHTHTYIEYDVCAHTARTDRMGNAPQGHTTHASACASDSIQKSSPKQNDFFRVQLSS